MFLHLFMEHPAEFAQTPEARAMVQGLTGAAERAGKSLAEYFRKGTK
jgi:hypothetical protein